MPIRKWKAGILALLTLAAVVVFTVPERTRLELLVPIRVERVKTRKFYLYSVIPGGAASGAELRNVLLRDRIAASHYAGFRLERMRVQTLSEPRKMFVSYRIADRIYWSRSRLQLSKGETILTDGTLSARTRCGNRISETPQLPVDALHEPAADVLNSEVPDKAEAAWDSPSAGSEEIRSRVAELTSTDAPQGDLLSRFGPESIGSLAGPGSRLEGSNNQGRLAGQNGQQGGEEPDTAGGTALSGSSSAAGGGTASSSNAPIGATFVAESTKPVGDIIAFPVFADFSPPVAHGRNYAPLQSSEELTESLGLTSDDLAAGSAVNFGHPVQRLQSLHLATPDSPLLARNRPSSSAVQTPEPRTLVLTVCGIALFCVPLLRNHCRTRRALR